MLEGNDRKPLVFLTERSAHLYDRRLFVRQAWLGGEQNVFRTTSTRLITSYNASGFIDMQHRLPKLVGIVSSQLGTSAQETLKAENHGAVAFLDVSPGSRSIRAG
jgi:hypothetical protein